MSVPIIAFILSVFFLLIIAKKRGPRGYRVRRKPGDGGRDTPWKDDQSRSRPPKPATPPPAEEPSKYTLHDDCPGKSPEAEDPFAADPEQFSSRDTFKK